jgi:hypothetical protein
MDLKRLAAAAAAIAASIGLPVLPGASATVNAMPLDPPPVDPGDGPGEPAPAPPPVGNPGIQPYTPRPPVMRVGPGGPKGGGGQPSYEQPHRVSPAPPPPPPPA